MLALVSTSGFQTPFANRKLSGRDLSHDKIGREFLLLLLGIGAAAVFAGAILIMIDMDRSSVTQGGRYYVAVAALVAL